MKEVRLTTAIIGVGNIGSLLAQHLVSHGEVVVLAAKDQSRAQALADEFGPLARAASVDDAIAGADAVVFALWLDTIKDLIPQYARLLEDKVVVDPSNQVGFDENGQITRRCRTSRPRVVLTNPRRRSLSAGLPSAPLSVPY